MKKLLPEFNVKNVCILIIVLCGVPVLYKVGLASVMAIFSILIFIGISAVFLDLIKSSKPLDRWLAVICILLLIIIIL